MQKLYDFCTNIYFSIFKITFFGQNFGVLSKYRYLCLANTTNTNTTYLMHYILDYIGIDWTTAAGLVFLTFGICLMLASRILKRMVDSEREASRDPFNGINNYFNKK